MSDTSVDELRETGEIENGARRPPLSITDTIACTCFFLSGFVGLTFEICWIRKASLILGAATFALSTVLAVFFAGLALGSYTVGRLTPRTSRPLRWYAALEIAIGVIAIATPYLFEAADSLYTRFYPRVYHSFALLSLIRFVLLVFVILPPAACMGGTLPLFCRHYVKQPTRIARSVGFLYGLNTLGAAAGTAITGFVAIRWLGVNTTILLGGMLNILIGLVVLRLPQATTGVETAGAAPAETTAPLPEERSGARRTRTLVASLFFLSGFVALAHEVLWTRFLSLLVRNTVYTYTLTLTVILLGIVLGSMLTSRYFDRSRRRAFVFGAVQFGIGLSVLTVLMLPARFWIGWFDTHEFVHQAGIVLLLLLLPSVLAGASFPLAVRMVVEQPSLAGRGVGRMTAINTVGGIAGSLATGFFILPHVGMHTTLQMTTALSLLIGCAAWFFIDRTTPLWTRGLLSLAGLLAWLAIPSLTGTSLPVDFLAGPRRLIDFREGLNSHMAVIEKEDKVVLEIDNLWQGEARMAGEDPHRHQVMAAHIPALLHPHPKRILVIGLGPGRTPSRFLYHEVEQLDCIEIESELVPLVRKHFDSAWLDDERVRMIVEDGRNYLTHTDADYDLISIEVGQVFRPGSAAFYTADFYRAARRRLSENGLMCQFVPVAPFTAEEFRTVVQTFLHVFPESTLWYNTSELLLIGTVGEAITLSADRLARLRNDARLRRDTDFSYWGDDRFRLNQPHVVVAGFLAGPTGLAAMSGEAPIYRDDLPYLEYTTARRSGYESVDDTLEIIRAHLEPFEQVLDPHAELASLSEAESIRGTNLDNIRANAVIRPVTRLRLAGRFDQAVELLRKAFESNPDHGHLQIHLQILLLDTLGQAHSARSELTAALDAYQETITLQERLVREHPDVMQFQNELAGTYNNVAVQIAQAGRLAEALAASRNAVRIQENMVEKYPHVDAYRIGLARSNSNLGSLLARNRRLDAARNTFERAIGDLEAMVRKRPDDQTAKQFLENARFGLRMVHKALVPGNTGGATPAGRSDSF